MNLRSYEGKNVVVELNNKKVYKGQVSDFIFAEDNNPPKNSIIVDAKNYENPIEIYEDEIKLIDVIN